MDMDVGDLTASPSGYWMGGDRNGGGNASARRRGKQGEEGGTSKTPEKARCSGHREAVLSQGLHTELPV